MNAPIALKFGITLLLAVGLLAYSRSPHEPHQVRVHTAPIATPTPAPAISEITVQHKPGMMEAKWSTVTVRSDGTATYIGYGKAPRVGTWRAYVSADTYAHLTQLVETSHFADMEPFYGSMVTDIPEVNVSVVRLGIRSTINDRGKPINKYDNEAPKSLTQIEDQVEASVTGADWKKVSDNWLSPEYSPSKQQVDAYLNPPSVRRQDHSDSKQ